MAINKIIEKQSVRIDDHLWGTREEKNWDRNNRDIHLDKRTLTRYDGKNINVTIKIPLNSEREIEITSNIRGMKNKNELQEIPRKLKKEIQDAFADEKVRKTFFEDIASVLKDFKSCTTSQERAIQALKKIAKAFGLDWNNLINLAFNPNQRNKYYAEISDKDELYLLTINQDYITAKDTMKKRLRND